MTGTVTHELWSNISGIEISDIPLSTISDKIDSMTELESFQQLGNNYGQRIRGYITAPSSGTYYFWISSDDHSQLWLSPDTNPLSKVMIASVSGYTNYREWNKYNSQKSSAINLIEGERYYIEILHKEGDQNDNMSVGWLKPRQSGSQPSEVVPSSVLSPYIIPAVVLASNGDSDNDGVSNGIEVYGPVKTDPNDSTSFIDYVIPSRTILNYSEDNYITLDFARFYPGYSRSSVIPFNIEAGTFSGNLAPLFQMRSIPKGLSEIPKVPGYSPIGLAMNFEYFPIEPGKGVEIPLPFTNTQITNGTECFMVIRKNDSCDIVHPTSVNPGYLTVTVDSTVKSVILIQKGMSFGSAVAYLDGGMIYSNDNGTSISTNIVLRNCQPGHVNGALMKVFYTDISDPFNPVNDSVVFPFDTVRVNEGYLLKSSDIVRFSGAVMANVITLNVPQYPISYIDSTMHNINRGQSLIINCDFDINYFSSIEKPVSASYGINYALESVSIDGEGRILQHRSGDSVSYSYDYYLKDHLGSTRMVINDENSITEKVAYQSYGTINPLDSSSPALPSREKFTGKEFDTQGADFARVEFDIAVREFDMSTGSGFIRVGYRDVATGNEFSKIYMARYDSKNRALRFTGSESFTGEIEIVQMFLMASGAPGGIFNIVGIDSFLVNPGKTRMIQLDVTSSEIVGTPIDTNLYSVHAAVDNRSYFSGTRLFYFGSRYYDPELGIWLSVDPAGQFANAYGYASNPVLMVDPDGNYFIIDDIIATVVGAIVGGVTAGLSGNNVWAGIGIGAAIGESSLYTAGATSAALGGGLAGAAVGGAVGGVMSSALNTGLLTGSSGIGTGWGNISGRQIGIAALCGGLGAGVGYGVGHGILGAMAGGFSSGAVGTALNGGDFGDVMLGGLSGAGTAAAGYLAYMGMSNIPQVNRMINQKVAYEGTSKALKLSDRAGTALEKQMYGDFADFNSGNPDIKTGESVASYRIKVGLLGPEALRNQNTSRYYKTAGGDQFVETGDAFAVHSHPTNAVAGPSPKDFIAAKSFARIGVRSYLYEANGNFSEYYVSQQRNLYKGVTF